MKRSFAYFLASSVSLLLAPPENVFSQSKESPPKSEYQLSIGGKNYLIFQNETSAVEAEGKRLEVTIREQPTRLFSQAGVTFRVSRDSLYSFEPDDTADMWRFEGRESNLMFLVIREDQDANYFETLVGMVSEDFGEALLGKHHFCTGTTQGV